MLTYSLVDYVLQRGNKDYGEFAPRKQLNSNTTPSLFNHRKMLEYLFTNNKESSQANQNGQQDLLRRSSQTNSYTKRISDLKAEQITGQFNYFSEKIHAQLNRKYLQIDSDLYKLENQWLKKKIPAFYCYYFLKFSYANSYSRLHQLILSEIENMSKEKDSFWIIKKTIEARQICLSNLRKQLLQLNDLDVEESLQTIKQERKMRTKILRQQGKEENGYKNANKGEEQPSNKSWKNKLELIFEAIEHLRKLSCYVIELIKNWKTLIYNVSQDPRRYRERIIFYFHESNYLLKMLWDCQWLRDSQLLKKFLTFADHYDPFILKPLMILESKTHRTDQQQIFFKLIKPSTQSQMDKIVKSLIILAEEEYDEDQQSRFINEKQNFGQLEQRKQYIEQKREGLVNRQFSHQKILLNNNYNSNKKIQQINTDKSLNDSPTKKVQFIIDKKSSNLANEIEQVKTQKQQLKAPSKLNKSSLDRVKKIRSVDLKKVSPYLSRNELLKKAQQVVQFQHKFRVAHDQYVKNVKNNPKSVKNMDSNAKAKMNQLIDSNKQVANSRIFNKYIQQNIRMLDEANKKAFLFKNRIEPQQRRKVDSFVNYNKIPYHDRKELQYERNLQKYLPRQTIGTAGLSMNRSKSLTNKNGSISVLAQNPSSPIKNSPAKRNLFGLHTSDTKNRKGTKAIIQITDRGIKSGQKIIQFELSGKKGKDVGAILQTYENSQISKAIEAKLTDPLSDSHVRKMTRTQNVKQQTEQINYASNLFVSEQPQEIIVLRQEPQKLEELKKSLYEQIKQQLLQQLRNSQFKKQQDLNTMIQQQKRRKLQQIIQQRRRQQQQRKEQDELMRVTQIQKQRKKLDIEVIVESTTIAEQNLNQWFNKLFGENKEIYSRLFTNQSTNQIRAGIESQLHTVFLKGYQNDQQMAYCSMSYLWRQQGQRKFEVSYLSTKYPHLTISCFHQFCLFMWKHDPLLEIQVSLFNNAQNQQGQKVVQDLKEYAARNGEVYEKQIYSNITEVKLVIYRPSISTLQNMNFEYPEFYFSKRFNLKSQLLSSAVSLSERHAPQIDMNLETYTNYIYLLEQIFRSYLTPEEIVQLRQNSTNIRRLKDIFRIVLEMQKGKPRVDELTVIEGINLEDLYAKMKDKVKPPYDKYYWNNFYDRTPDNRLLLSILSTKLQIPYSINSAFLNDKRMFRINIQNKILVLRSSIYSKEDIYILSTDNPKIRIFLMQGQAYKLMRIELFIFLNLIFNNIVEDGQKYINSIWIPQFAINKYESKNKQKRQQQQSKPIMPPTKKVKRITDFSISMKKSFFLSEQIYFCNHEYVKNGIFPIVKPSDVLFKQSMIFGMLHTEVQKSSTGMPIYAKLIDRNEFF